MKDRSEFEGLELPPELAELDAELSSIAYEERPSFGPELHAELCRRWAAGVSPRRNRFRPLMAAGVAGLLMVGLGVPSARAALVRFVDDVLQPDVAAEESLRGTPTPTAGPFLLDPSGAEPPEGVSARLRIPAEPPAGPVAPVRYDGPEATFPEIVDRSRVEQLIRAHYPTELQADEVGGVVGLRLWVDSLGSVEIVNLSRGSGVPALDRAAMLVAPQFVFEPARRRGRAVDTWVEFDVVFRPRPPEPRQLSEPARIEVGEPDAAAILDARFLPEWSGDVMLPSASEADATTLLARALGGEQGRAGLGSIDAVLAGDPPAGMAPTAWRGRVSAALEAAMVRDPDNPAPLLALGRLRKKQGLRTEARVLFERGLQRAQRATGMPPGLLADLHYERGSLVKEGWLTSRFVGRVAAGALPRAACAQARSSGGAASGYASADRLIAWNYLCPAELGRAFDAGFEAVSLAANERDRAVMMGSFRSAVDAFPAHPGANVELLLALADEGRWDEVLEGARRFVWASRGHPYGLLLSGMALHHLTRTEEAQDQFTLALRGLPAPESDALLDITPLLPPKDARAYLARSGDERAAWRDRYFARLDPILSTAVNEREMEHLARASYAHLRFAGIDTDPGSVWLRYGRPARIRVVGESSGVRTEFWDYGDGPDITFRRMSSSLRMDLTPEARSYLDDLMEVFPHRYGADARTVFVLPGQVSRFRGAMRGATDVEIHTKIPSLLATGSSDTLDLGIFLLDSEGEKVAVSQRRVLALASPLSLRTPASPGVASVVVEFFHRQSGKAAALRDRVELAEHAGPSISDLLLTEVAAPSTAEVQRGAEWLKPLPLDEPVAEDALGVFFELYGVLGTTPWYRVRAEVVRTSDGAILDVPVRVAGQRGFRPTWDRRPTRQEGPLPEFVSVALSDVPTGEYLLRVVVDLDGGAAPLVAERSVTRR